MSGQVGTLGVVLALVGGVLVFVSAIWSSNDAAGATEVGLWIAILSNGFQGTPRVV